MKYAASLLLLLILIRSSTPHHVLPIAIYKKAPIAVMRAALALRLGITVPHAPAPIASTPLALVLVDWSNDADESEEEAEIQEERDG